MKIKNLIKELEEKQSYKNFKLKYPSAFFSVAFIILEFKNSKKQIQLDFFLPEKNRVASFDFPFGEPKIFDDEVKTMAPQSSEIKIDIDDLAGICEKTTKEKGLATVLERVIAILRDGVWNLTCMDDMLSIVRMKVNATTGEVTDFSKGALADFIKIKHD